MVASANPIASLIGTEVLRWDGNAVDAAVAMAVALTVLEPERSQLGSDVYLQFWDASARRSYALTGSGKIASAAGEESLAKVMDRWIDAASVPAAPHAWLTALSQWGTMPADDIFAPAIALANDGFAFPKEQFAAMVGFEDLWNEFPDAGRALAPDPYRIGGTLYQADLARTLESLAKHGLEWFYHGKFAQNLVYYVAKRGGCLNLDDLAAHSSLISDVLRLNYRGVTVTAQPGLTQGYQLLEALSILRGYTFDDRDPENPDVIHAIINAKHFAARDPLANMGTPSTLPIDAILSDENAEQHRQRIDPRLAPSYGFHTVPSDSNFASTALCVVDARGNAVSLTQSSGSSFGCGEMVPGTGVLLNNLTYKMADDARTRGPNLSRTRPSVPATPFMLFKDNELWCAGASGDIQFDLQCITQMVDHQRTPQESLESAKWRVSPSGRSFIVEDRMPLDACYSLRQRGHSVSIKSEWGVPCGSQLISLDVATGALFGASDPREHGLVLGY